MVNLSIVITYYRGEKFIFNCINSIENSFKASSGKINFEVIVVIDSIEDSDYIYTTLLKTYAHIPLKVIKNQKNIGVSKSRNIGLKNIKYNFYTVIDQDDYVKTGYFSTLESELDATKAIHILNGTIRTIDKNTEISIFTLRPTFNFRELIFKNAIIYTPGLLIFNADFISSDNFFIDTSNKYKGCDDWAAYLNILAESNTEIPQKFISRPLFVYCLHAQNYSYNREELIRSSEAVLDFLSKKDLGNKRFTRYIQESRRMQRFYIAKDVDNFNIKRLFFSFPSSFLSHYFFSFFNKSRLNRLIYRVKYFISAL